MELQTSWPFVYLVMSFYVGGLLLLGSYRTTDGLSTTKNFDSWLKRLSDVRWYMLFALPLYALHQFEEYGIDFHGRHFEFHNAMCSKLGYSVSNCVIRPWHLTLVNAGLVTFASVRTRLPGAALGAGANFYGFALVNGFFHLLITLRDVAAGEEAYNPGLITAVFTLVPCGFGVLRALRSQGMITGFGVARAMAIGVLAHIILLFGLFARSRDDIGNVSLVLLLSADLVGLLSVTTA